MRPAVALAIVAATLTLAEPPAGMIFLPAGDFLRGRTHEMPDTKLDFYPNPLRDDLPARRITLSPFYLDAAEVTISDYAAFIAATRHRTPPVWRTGLPPHNKDNFPVTDVSFDDAAAYCKWRGKRLPTEAEWERACRGFAVGETYPWGNREPKPADARYNSLDGPSPVCSYPKTNLGLCDIIGNVWEWTSDFYGKDYYAESPVANPPGPKTGIYRVLRGGSWFDEPSFLACSYRTWARPNERSPNIGFRCAVSFSGAKAVRPAAAGKRP
jgi:formylglycine-generating enzyme required for sulfatase activity